ncbi:hypothetical protein AB0K09_15320 [Streptomyces sp. NPDC049577]|uniref:hypothetical protein n=1 Tax=Streptomyces sp. NPDC049577 TaxID=3155153 RepID=UPI003424F1CF
MPTSTPGRLGHRAATAVLLGTAIFLTACGTEHATGSAAGAAPSPSASSVPTASPASPYVEPGAGDGAPHYRENNGFRIEGEMSPADAKDAKKEADRIEPVIKRLWEEKKWDPASVRAALLGLGYEEERHGPKGERLGGTLTVRELDSRWETDHYVRPEGAEVALRVHEDACVTAFVQKTNYQVTTNGLYPEGGCFQPAAGH